VRRRGEAEVAKESGRSLGNLPQVTGKSKSKQRELAGESQPGK
jgi:hypothetical protein